MMAANNNNSKNNTIISRVQTDVTVESSADKEQTKHAAKVTTQCCHYCVTSLFASFYAT